MKRKRNLVEGASEPLWRTVLRALPSILIVSLITTQLHNCGFLRPFENTALDTLIRIYPVSAKHVFVVGICNSDYERIFAGESPLDPEKISQLLDAVAAGEPKAIVVDLDTSDPRFAKVRMPHSPVNIIWACRAASASSQGLYDSDTITGASSVPRMAKVLGQDQNQLQALWGVANLPQDSDGVIRHYSRYVEILNPASLRIELAPTLSWKAVQVFRNNFEPGSAPGNAPMVLCSAGSSGYVPRISAGDLLSTYQGQGWKDIAKGKIVLVGGYYDAARDSYATPTGKLSGVELHAQAIESELIRGGIHEVSPAILFAAQVLASLLFVAISAFFASGWPPLIGLLAIPIAAFLFSLVAFSSLYMWADFVPVLCTVQLQQLVEHVKNVRRSNLELKRANADLEATRLELARAIDRGAERERKRLAHEIHDDTLGQLFQVSVSLQPLAGSSETGSIAEKALDTVRKAQQSLRNSLINLYPPVLDRYGLCGAIEDLISRVKDKIEIHLSGCTTMPADALDKETQLALYRITQESVNNVIKHAKATAVRIELQLRNSQLVLSVTDNGKGMSSDGGRSDSFGIGGMRNKAMLIGADIRWISPPPDFPGGTEMRLTMPLQKNGSESANSPPKISNTESPAQDRIRTPERC